MDKPELDDLFSLPRGVRLALAAIKPGDAGWDLDEWRGAVRALQCKDASHINAKDLDIKMWVPGNPFDILRYVVASEFAGEDWVEMSLRQLPSGTWVARVNRFEEVYESEGYGEHSAAARLLGDFVDDDGDTWPGAERL